MTLSRQQIDQMLICTHGHDTAGNMTISNSNASMWVVQDLSIACTHARHNVKAETALMLKGSCRRPI